MSVRPAISTPASERADPRRSLGLEQCTLAVLMGGRSSEREVSLSSGRMVLHALTTPGSPEDRRGPARVLGIELHADGSWRVGPRALRPGRALEELETVDLFFSALHGGEGENGALQGLLSCCDRRFTGSGVISSALCLDKVFARDVVAAAGVRVAPGLCLARSAPVPADLWVRLGAGGCVVKPRRGGSSLGCSLVHEPDRLPDALARAFDQGRQVLVEAYVPGVEVTGGVLQEPGGELLALPPVEIRPRASFFDYHEKYAEDGALELCPPESLSPEQCERVQRLALACHQALGCEGYSRTDFLVPARGGEPVFLETNTLPGLTPRSLLPRAATELGIDYRTLCLWIAAHGLGASREEG